MPHHISETGEPTAMGSPDEMNDPKKTDGADMMGAPDKEGGEEKSADHGDMAAPDTMGSQSTGK